jgi:hypothetical protein
MNDIGLGKILKTIMYLLKARYDCNSFIHSDTINVLFHFIPPQSSDLGIGVPILQMRELKLWDSNLTFQIKSLVPVLC